jgi:hypothetical protein
MNVIKSSWLLLFLFIVTASGAQTVTVKSPDSNIVVTVINNASLSWSAMYKGKPVVNTSQLGFELKDEQPLAGNFEILSLSLKGNENTCNNFSVFILNFNLFRCQGYFK